MASSSFVATEVESVWLWRCWGVGVCVHERAEETPLVLLETVTVCTEYLSILCTHIPDPTQEHALQTERHLWTDAQLQVYCITYTQLVLW
jgi:hypothetical protein